MENTPTITLREIASLTIVKKEKKENAPAKLVTIKQLTYKSHILLPPPQDNYIKPKNHDFF